MFDYLDSIDELSNPSAGDENQAKELNQTPLSKVRPKNKPNSHTSPSEYVSSFIDSLKKKHVVIATNLI